MYSVLVGIPSLGYWVIFLPEQEVTEDDERIMSMFMASDAAPQRTLADIIMERINEKDMGGNEAAEVEGQLYNL